MHSTVFRFVARVSAAIAIATATSACEYDCGTVASTVATGEFRDGSGATLATAQANLSDNIGPSSLHLSVGVMGPAESLGAPLRGHVTSARLVTGTGELIAEIPTGTETLFRDAVVVLNRNLSSRDKYRRVRDALLTNQAKVILETDVAGLEHVEAMLTDAHDVAGPVGRCNPVS